MSNSNNAAAPGVDRKIIVIMFRSSPLFSLFRFRGVLGGWVGGWVGVEGQC